jgi:hypothetical protein
MRSVGHPAFELKRRSKSLIINDLGARRPPAGTLKIKKNDFLGWVCVPTLKKNKNKKIKKSDILGLQFSEAVIYCFPL